MTIAQVHFKIDDTRCVCGENWESFGICHPCRQYPHPPENCVDHLAKREGTGRYCNCQHRKRISDGERECSELPGPDDVREHASARGTDTRG